ncbi:MAG: decaprenylphospho-beta-D-erythro-pentofuranosid-2-ulose 2-reductase, partial [Planctomycetota bacterium]
MSLKSVIVVGASSGVGAALALRFAKEGRPVAILARRAEKLESVCKEATDAKPDAVIKAYPHDVLNFSDVPALFDQIESDLGAADTLIYASGVLPEVGPEEFNNEKDLSIIQIGFTGAISWLNEAANRFTAAGGGTICGISSIAGERGRTGMPSYHAAKAG